MQRPKRCSIGGRFVNNEIPLLFASLYLSNEGRTRAARFSEFVSVRTLSLLDSSFKLAFASDSSFGDISQIGSLAGAAHLLQINAGVLRRAQKEQKSFVEHKGKSSLDKRSSVPIRGVKARPNDPLDSIMIKRQCRR